MMDLSFFRLDCSHFDVGDQEFPLVTELEQDISQYEEMWKLYEEFNLDLETMSQQDWISFR